MTNPLPGPSSHHSWKNLAVPPLTTIRTLCSLVALGWLAQAGCWHCPRTSSVWAEGDTEDLCSMGTAEHSVKNAKIQTWLSAPPSESQPKPWLTLTVKLNQARQLLRDEQWENVSATRLTFQYIYLAWEFGIWGVHPTPAHTAFLKCWTRGCRGIMPSPTISFLKSCCKRNSSCIGRFWDLFPGSRQNCSLGLWWNQITSLLPRLRECGTSPGKQDCDKW